MERKIEQLVVWALIMEPKEFPEVSNILTPEDFIDSTCRHAYMTIQKMTASGKDVDLPGLYFEMGRPQNISTLIENEEQRIFPASHYALLLKKRNVEDAIHKSTKDREYEETQERIKQLQDLSKPTSLLTISKMVEQTVQVKQAYPTGYTDLDGLVSFRPSDLLILAGRTSIGKSTFGLTVLSNMAMSFPVGMVSFEMSPGGVAERLSKICTLGYLGEIESNFFVACPTAFNLMNTRKSISDMVKTKKIRVVMVDFLQLMQEQRRFTSRHLEVSHIIRQLKEFAKEFQVGLIVVAQLSRAIDTRGENARPVLGDLKECVTPGTMISLKGMRRKIKSLFDYKHTDFKVKTLNIETGKINYINPDKAIHSGKQKCLKIRTKKGNILFVSEQTKIFTEAGWVEAKNLIPGMKVFTEKGAKNIRAGARLNTGSSSFSKGMQPLNLELDEIMEVSDVGEHDTYDLTIPETHCFFANGILTHNTGDIEHAADIVLFLHRAKHDKEAELIVAKNRYGGKGIIQLVWLEEKTKYGPREWKRESGGEG